MKADRWKLVDDLLQSALELAPERREDFLRQAGNDDPALADEVMSLLTAHRKSGDFLRTPAAEMAARAIAAEAAPSLSASRDGQIVSHYRLLNMIGSGGMGTVWLAERCDGRFERKVAIKFIHLAVLDAAGAERFKREGAILGKLAHPQKRRKPTGGPSKSPAITPRKKPFRPRCWKITRTC
jgi:serine/threonine protein kinase